MRETQDTIENMGIQRSRLAAQRAMVIIHLLDATHPVDTLAELEGLEDKKIIHVYNKADLLGYEAIRLLGDKARISISAKKGDIAQLKDELVRFAEEQSNLRNAVTISNTRHYEALLKAQAAIQRVADGLAMQISGEFLSMDLQDCLAALGEITGQITSQEVLNNIFSKFCIGK
jgi:tRNA modification GTPase